MKIYVSNTSQNKVKNIIESQKPGLISTRKSRPGDPVDNVFQHIKLPDKYRAVHKTGKTYSFYITKQILKDINAHKEGGFLPLIPLILGGISALGALTGGVAGITKTVLDKKANDVKNEEEQRHNREMERVANERRAVASMSIAKGSGLYLSPPVRDVVNGSALDNIGKKMVHNFLKNLSKHFKIESQGSGIYLSPFPR
jgi:hypothetical protein